MSLNFHSLAELFNTCLKESCFPDCWKVSLVVPVFKNVGEKSVAKNYCPVILQSHHQLQDALDVGLLKHMSLWRFN